MGVLNRRQFLNRGTLAVAAAGIATAIPGLPNLLEDDAPDVGPAADASTGAVDDVAPAMDEPVVARVNDVNTGEIQLFYGTNSVTINDPQLASRIARVAQ